MHAFSFSLRAIDIVLSLARIVVLAIPMLAAAIIDNYKTDSLTEKVESK